MNARVSTPNGSKPDRAHTRVHGITAVDRRRFKISGGDLTYVLSTSAQSGLLPQPPVGVADEGQLGLRPCGNTTVLLVAG